MTKKTYKKAQTLAGVAELAGVSTAAVSVVMREEMGQPVKSGRMKFSPETREKILKVVRDTGYKPNAFSQALASGKSSLIGYIQQAELSVFKFEYTIGIEDQAATKRYGTLMATIHQNNNMDFNPFDLMLEKRVDGMLMLCNADRFVTPDIKEKLENMAVPVVYLGHIPQVRIKNSGSVCVNGETIGNLAISHLLELGHKHITCINSTDWINTGIKKAAKSSQANIEYWSHDTHVAQPMLEIANRWMNMKQRPTAIYVNSDYFAISLMNLLAGEGVKIPEDVSIIGTDGIDMGKDSIVPLTTINQPKYEQGLESAKLLFSIIEGGKGTDIILEPNLEIRKSTAKPSE